MVGPAIASPDSGEGRASLFGEHPRHPNGQRSRPERRVMHSQTAHRRPSSLYRATSRSRNARGPLGGGCGDTQVDPRSRDGTPQTTLAPC